MNIRNNFTMEGYHNATFINPYSFLMIVKSGLFDEISDKFVVYIDGILLVWIAKIFFREKVERFSFDDTSIAPLVFNNTSNDFKIGILGSSVETISTAKRIMGDKYSLKDIVYNDGYFDESDTEKVLHKFVDCDLVICSMGAPLQELMLLNLRKLGWEGVGYTCGGFFDQLVSAGGDDYYPYLINKFDLRWMFRLFKEPKRLWRRYLISYPVGVVLFIKFIFKNRIRFSIS